MKLLAMLALILGLPVIAGCGSQGEAQQPSTSAASGTATTTTTAAKLTTIPANLDAGPRAQTESRDEARAEVGEKLFSNKGCTACHAFGQKMSGPDMAGVTTRRTSKWMENQILHPDLMVKQDPAARALFAQFALQMPRQGLSADEARAVIEYLKKKDHEASESH